MSTASLLCTGLENAFRLPLYFNESLAFVDGECEWLFAINVFTGLHRGDGNQCMPVINRAADDGIDVFPLQQLAEVGITFGAGEILLSGRQVAGVNVTYGNNSSISPGISCIAPALSAAADQCKVDFLAGRLRFSPSSWFLSGAFVD